MSQANKPLAGRRVAVTRAAEQAGELALRLEALGAEVLLLPLVAFAAAADPEPLDRALAKLEAFDWLFVTSGNAVRFLAARARAISVDLVKALDPQRAGPRVAVVGPGTERAVRRAGWRVDYVSDGRGGRDLAAGLRDEIRGRRILLPRSARAGSELPSALANAGATPVGVVAYRTVTAENLDSEILGQIGRGEVDVVSFSSPSEFESLAAHLSTQKLLECLHSVLLAAIGPTTASAIRQAGFRVAIEAASPSAAGLAESIAAYFVANPVTGKESE
jgi:uroporphyrinogen-III synthase